MDHTGTQLASVTSLVVRYYVPVDTLSQKRSHYIPARDFAETDCQTHFTFRFSSKLVIKPLLEYSTTL